MSAADKLAQALRDVLVTLNRANQHPGPITDTIWHGPGETLFDFIENTLAAHEAEKAAPVAAPYAWGVSGIERPFYGRDAELEAHFEARRIGGTAEAFPLYRHAPAAPVAVPLTDEQIVDCWNSVSLWTANPKHDFARAIERTLAARWGIKLEGDKE